MKKTLLLSGVLTAIAVTASAQYTQVGQLTFDGSDVLSFGAVQTIPTPEPAAGDSVSTTTLLSSLDLTPPVAIPAGGDGNVQLIAANNVTGAAQVMYQLLDPSALITTPGDYAVEATLMPFVGDNNAGGSTNFGGMGIRMDAARENGYYVEIRTDTSGSFGSYASVYALDAGTADFLGRLYFLVGSNGLQADFDGGDFVGSVVVNSPEASQTNTFFDLRLEAQGNRFTVLINGVSALEYFDPTPIADGDIMIFHDDPFNSQTNPSASAGTVFETITIFDSNAPSSVENWEILE